MRSKRGESLRMGLQPTIIWRLKRLRNDLDLIDGENISRKYDDTSPVGRFFPSRRFFHPVGCPTPGWAELLQAWARIAESG
jgi:hypothetical protein